MFDLLFLLIDYLNKYKIIVCFFFSKTISQIYLRQLAACVIASNDEFGFVVCIDAIYRNKINQKKNFFSLTFPGISLICS